LSDIYLHGNKIESIFELLGDRENDITYSIGWALAKSQAFLHTFVKAARLNVDDIPELTIQLQEFKQSLLFSCRNSSAIAVLRTLKFEGMAVTSLSRLSVDGQFRVGCSSTYTQKDSM